MFIFITLIVLCILTGVEVDLFTPSIPELRQAFGLTPFAVQLVLSVNFIAYCISCLFCGVLGDRFNRRTIILAGLGIFVVGSVFCVFANSFALLLIGRFLQGAGIAGPVALVFAEIMDQFPKERLPSVMGVVNGVTTIAMAFAPVIGSYVNLFFAWQGNFVVLLALGIISFVMGYAAIPSRQGDPTIAISPMAYWPLLKSPRLMIFALSISVLIVPYWLFIGISPILYMESFGVTLQHFGLYQGALAAAFGILSLLSARILSALGQRRCLHYGIILTCITLLLFIWLTITDLKSPLIITSVMVIGAIAVLFPLNILFPLSIDIIPNAKGRSTAIILSARLVFTAAALQIVSYFYHGTLFPISLTMAICLIVFLPFMWLLMHKKWVTLHN